MKNSYKFFRNIDCKYFPCHKVSDNREFNCMFCYCPLYFLEDCGGNYEVKSNIKSCINCNIPHTNNGYEYIMKKIKENIKRR